MLSSVVDKNRFSGDEFKSVSRVVEAGPIEPRLPRVFVVSKVKVKVGYITKNDRIAPVGYFITQVLQSP